MSFVLTGTEAASPPPSTTLKIGLLNNLGDGGLERGERQIIELLAAIPIQRFVTLSLFTLPSIARGPKAKARIDSRYASLDALLHSDLDGLIVTGCEPQASSLPREAFWHELTEVIDWAEHHTRSTIWSCLAAHATVLHLDGISRRRLPGKCSGIFKVEPVTPHHLFEGASGRMCVSHSRWNALDEESLVTAGYEILTRGVGAGVDTFIKQWRSLFVYLQGHPEYDAEALGREYKRDVDRYLIGVSRRYPTIPANYFDARTEATLLSFEAEARHDHAAVTSIKPMPPSAALPARLAHFPQIFFRNWLAFLCGSAAERKASDAIILRRRERPL